MTFDRRSAGVAVAGMVTFINLYSVQAVLPTLAQAFDVPVGRTGLAVTASTAAVALVAPLVGSVSDMLGRKRLIVAAAFALTVPTLLAGFADSLPALLAWRFAQGLMLPFIFAVTVAYIGDETSGGETIKLAGSYSVGTIFGGFAGRFVAGLVAGIAGWRASFFVLAALTVLGAAFVAAVLPAERNFRPVRGWRRAAVSFADHLSNARLIATFAVGFAVLFSIVAGFTFANFLLAAPPYDFGPAALGSVFVVYLVGMVSTPLATRLAVRIGRRPTLAVAVAVAVAGMALSLLPSLAAIVGGLALLSAGVFIEGALSIAYIGAAARRAKSTAVGLYVTVYYIGGSLGGILPASIWHRAGWPGCVALVIAVQLAMLALALVAWRSPQGAPA